MHQNPISLRALEPEDLTLLYTIENDPDIWDSSNANGPYSRYTLKQYIASSSTIYESGEQRFVIDVALVEENKKIPIGLIDITNYAPLDSRAEVGVVLLKEYRGQGYGLQALTLVENYVTRWLRMHSLYAQVLVSNTYSCKLFEKAGYVIVSKLPKWHYVNGIYEDVFIFMKTFSSQMFGSLK